MKLGQIQFIVYIAIMVFVLLILGYIAYTLTEIEEWQNFKNTDQNEAAVEYVNPISVDWRVNLLIKNYSYVELS